MPGADAHALLPDLERLAELIRGIAREELLPRLGNVARELKSDASVVTEADRAAQERLRAELAARWPGYRLLGEEMSAAEQGALLAAPGDGLWIVDPLDGTSNFAAGIPFFSVSVALLGPRGVELGVVYDPSRDECFRARRGGGARLGDTLLRPASFGLPLERTIAAVDFKRLSADLAVRLAEAPPYASQRSFGSVALDWCWVAAGRFHVYLHGRQKLWDYAAGSLILAEAGGRALTLEGQAVPVAGITPRSAVAALDPELFRAWCDWLGLRA